LIFLISVVLFHFGNAAMLPMANQDSSRHRFCCLSFGYPAGFLTLTVIAMAPLIFFVWFMPETRPDTVLAETVQAVAVA
jgi:hypothetical protein